jgi:lipopolysaccharide biosynthesis protein
VVKILPNRGWDIAPFILGFAEEVRNHDICLKLHGKRSNHNSRGQGARWRRHLLSGLLGSPDNVGFIVGTFLANPDLGVLMMRHWKGITQGVNVGVNYLPMQALLRRVSLSISPDWPIEFPSGSMFWFRAAALAPLLELGLAWQDFAECRARNRDATIAHGIERCILIFAAKAGFRWAFLPRRWVPRHWRLGMNGGNFRRLAGLRDRAAARQPGAGSALRRISTTER